MSETENIMKAFSDHRREMRGDIGELRQATTDMAKAVADLTTTVARVEERHAKHDDGLRRVGRIIDDHEKRIRDLESTSWTRGASIIGGWKVLTIIGGLAVATVGIVIAVAEALK